VRQVGHHPRIQLRASQIEGERPNCPRECGQKVHRHGFYERYVDCKGQSRERIARFLCRVCRLTISVLSVHRLPYRAVRAQRLADYFNEKAEVGSGPDPPPGALEAGCLRRAWARFQARVIRLKDAFGLLLPSTISSGPSLWQQFRRTKGSLEEILKFLAQTHKISLLGDYRCLRLPD
jgi:hypothetical protein